MTLGLDGGAARVPRKLPAGVGLLLLLPAIQTWAQGPATSELPSFEGFRVSRIFRGTPAEPVLGTPFARAFGTRIRSAARSGPNFAGKFAIAHWGCGTTCISIAVVDEESGAVYEGPFRFLDYDGAIVYPDGSSWASGSLKPFSYRRNSRLLVVRGCPDSRYYEGCAIFYYEWQMGTFRLLKKLPAEKPAGDR